MILVAPGIVGTDAQGSDHFTMIFFNGAVPTTELDLGNKNRNLWKLLDDTYCGATSFTPTIFEGKHTKVDNLRLTRLDAGLNVPFGLVDVDLYEGYYRLQAKNQKFESTQGSVGYLRRFGIETHAINTAHTQVAGAGAYRLEFGEADAKVGDAITLEYPYKHVAKKINLGIYTGGNPINYGAYVVMYGWDYDLNDWVEVVDFNGTYAALQTFELEANTLLTDKYKLVYVTQVTYRPIFTRFELLTDTPPDHTPAQPTWAMLLNRTYVDLHIAEPYGMPYLMAPCSGPTGTGEFIIHNDNLEIGEHINLLSNEIAFGSIWEEL